MDITHFDQLDLSKSYTYFDYLKWKLEERVELIKGKVFKMSPAPASRHQRISSELGYFLTAHLRPTSCQVFYAPFDVRLERTNDNSKVKSVVQPDICVICDLTKIDEKGCSGAPDLIVEILSPGNTIREMSIKFDIYQEAGVQEYWIVDPEKETILQYILENNVFVNHRPLSNDQTLKSSIILGFELHLGELFKK